MNKTDTKHRRKLNDEQLEVLKLLHTFRFGSNNLFAQYFGKKDRSFVFKRLKILLEQGLIAKHFDSSYRIQGKPAAYYLLPAGARALQKDESLNLAMIYKSKSASEQFIAHCLSLFSMYNLLKSVYPELRCFTKSDLNQEKYSYFPKPLPDAFLSLKKDEGSPSRFFLELLDSSTPSFAHKRRIKQYIDYAEDGDWEATKNDFPAILLICETESLQQKMHRQIPKLLQHTDEDIAFYMTTKEQLKTLKENAAIWRNAADFDERLPLQDIS